MVGKKYSNSSQNNIIIYRKSNLIKKMNEPEKMLELVREALNYFDDTNYQLSKIMKKAIHIARLRNDYENLFWLKLEIITIRGNAFQDLEHDFIELIPKSKVDYLTKVYENERKIRQLDKNNNYVDKGDISMASISGIEEVIKFLTSETEKSSPNERARIILNTIEYRNMLAGIEYRVHEFLSNTEKQLKYSQINTDIFEKYRKYVDLKLSEIAPETLEQFTTAYKRSNEENSEARSHAVLSCRRILKSIADHIYPVPKEPVIGSDGKVRELTDEKYIARLWQYIAEKAKGTASGDLSLAQINDLGNRLDKIYDLANKGTHADVSEFEVNQCVIQTYLLIGDILFLEDKSNK